MNVAIFTESFPPMLNGVAISVETFAQELERLGSRVFIFAPAYRGFQETNQRVFRFRSFHPPQVPDYPLSFPYSSTVFSDFGSLHIDVVHTHSPFILGQVGAFLARRFHLPLVFTYHTLLSEYVHYVPLVPGVARRLLVRLSRIYCNRASTVIVPTPAVRDVLRRYGVLTPIAVIPTGVDLQPDPNQREALRQRWGVAENTLVLLFVGRIAREKNVGLLLRTYAHVVPSLPETRLVLVGGGPELESSRALAEALGIAERTHFMGPVPHDQIAAYYSASDLFLFPSVTETQGIVLAEAMAAGLPCVAARAYGAAQMVRHETTGLLAEPSVEALSAAVLTLARQPELRRRMGQQGRSAAQALSISPLTRQLLAIYESATRRSGAREGAEDFPFPS